MCAYGSPQGVEPYHHQPPVYALGNFTVSDYTAEPSPVKRSGDVLWVHYPNRAPGATQTDESIVVPDA
jgi:hypothetical protein